jgi:hypothetical protein
LCNSIAFSGWILVSSTVIQIVDRRSGQLVDAVLHESLSVDDILQAEAAWGPARVAALQRLLGEGCPEDRLPEHFHWDWSRKIGRLQLPMYRCLGVKWEGQMQGRMMVALTGHVARLPPDEGKPLVYVDFIETAPWNVSPLAKEPRFGGIGMALLEAAIRLSVAAAFCGRIGLHALPQAEVFYRNKCAMTLLGPDEDYNALAYFEFTEEQAVKFLKQGE